MDDGMNKMVIKLLRDGGGCRQPLEEEKKKWSFWFFLVLQVSNAEAAEAARGSELNILKEQNVVLEKEKDTLKGLQLSCDEMSIKAASLESQRDGLIDQAVQDEQVKELSDRVAGLDSELMALALHLDEEFYPRIQTRLVAGIDHKKAERGLADVVAYDPFVEASLSISVTATSASSIPPILVADYDVLDARIQGEVPHSPKIVFEKETLETTPERPMTI
ncbi:hypothetical protein Tco_0794528 [Tanacetum coccineum]